MRTASQTSRQGSFTGWDMESEDLYENPYMLQNMQNASNEYINYIDIDVAFQYTDENGVVINTTVEAYFDLHDVVYTASNGRRYAQWNCEPMFLTQQNTLVNIEELGSKQITVDGSLDNIVFPGKRLSISVSQIIEWQDRKVLKYETKTQTVDGKVTEVKVPVYEQCKALADRQGAVHGFKPQSREQTTGYKSTQDVWTHNNYYKSDGVRLGHPQFGKTFENNLIFNIAQGISSLVNDNVGFEIGMGYKKSVGNTNKSTHHFVYVYGCGMDGEGAYFLYADNGQNGIGTSGEEASGKEDGVLSEANKAYLKYSEDIGFYMYSNRWGYVTEFRLPK